MKHSLVAEGHYMFGWWIFLFLTLLVSPLLVRIAGMHDTGSKDTHAAPALPGLPRRSRFAASNWQCAAISGLILAPGLIAVAGSIGQESGGNPEVVQLEYALSLTSVATSVVTPAERMLKPNFKGFAAESLDAYTTEAGRVLVYVNRYERQRVGAKLATAPSDWLPDGASIPDEPIAAEAAGQSTEGFVRIIHDETDWLVAYGFIAGDRFLQNPRAARTGLIVESLKFSGNMGFVAILMPCDGHCGTAMSALHSLIPVFADALRETLAPQPKEDA